MLGHEWSMLADKKSHAIQWDAVTDAPSRCSFRRHTRHSPPFLTSQSLLTTFRYTQYTIRDLLQDHRVLQTALAQSLRLYSAAPPISLIPQLPSIATVQIMSHPSLGFALSLPFRHSCSRKSLTHLTPPPISSATQIPRMTLHPQDHSHKEERDRRAIESEFLIPVSVTTEVDSNMAVLRQRIQMLGRKEKQWTDVVHQLTSMSMLTGIPLINVESGEPTARAWVLLALSAAVPLYVLCLVGQWLHSTSVSLSQLL